MARQLMAVIGSGGKTTALGLLAAQRGTALVTTTTHICLPAPPARCVTDPDKAALLAALEQPGVLWAGATGPDGKLQALPEAILRSALERADTVLYEGDGSRGLPLKLHRRGDSLCRGEPVLLPGTHRVLVVAGLSALGRPVGEAVHRWQLGPAWSPHQLVDGDVFLHCVSETADSAALPYDRLRVFLNQADACADPALAEILAARLRSRGLQTRVGSLRTAPAGLYRWLAEE